MKQKEKKKNKMFSRKRLVLSLVFLCLIFSFLISFASDASAASKASTFTDSVTTKGHGFLMEFAATPFLAAMNALLYAVFAFFGLFLIIAGVLLDWAINPNNFALVMNMDAIKTTWITVRDFLNLFFIMVLLFSAFCTIFQVSKYSIKKILLTLVIMALLVNFSYPISRFIIDAANIPMYFIINNTFPGLSNESGISTLLVSFSELLINIIPKPEWFSFGKGPMGSQFTIKLIAANIFVFILTISLLIMAILFIVRMIVLAILIMFSPVGFVASIFPGLNSFSSKWWDALLKQAFWGPIMAFMLYIALKVMVEMQRGGSNSIGAQMKKFAYANGGNFSEIIVGGVAMAIPVVLIWIGMISAKQMGAIGADKAQKWATKAVKWAVRAPFKYSGAEGAAKKFWGDFKKEGKLFGKKVPLAGSVSREAREEKLAGFMSGGKKGYQATEEKEMKKRADEYKKTKTTGEMMDMAKRGDVAAAYQLALDGDIDKDAYKGAMANLKTDGAKKLLERKTREKRVDTVAKYRIEIETEERARKIAGTSPVTDDHRKQAREKIAEDEIGKVAPSKWKDQDMKALAGFDEKTNKYILNRENKAIIRAAKKVYNNASAKNQEKITEDMTGDKYAIGKKLHIWPKSTPTP